MKWTLKSSFDPGSALLMVVLAGALGSSQILNAGEPTTISAVIVSNGVVMPARPVAVAMADAMQFLKRADDGYVPGRIDRELAGYFTSVFVKPDGTRSSRQLAYPARQHAYFILTFLRYYAYTGEPEWWLRARDLADWNLAHRTPATALYANLPYSTISDGRPAEKIDPDSIEPDKAAFFGSACVRVYEITGDRKYLAGARAIAETLARQQREDGSWPFRVVPEDGRVAQDFGGAPVFFVEFFENLLRYEPKATYRRAHDRALKLLLQRHVERRLWGPYHEDVSRPPESHLSSELMCFTADYLFRRAPAHTEYVGMGRQILRQMEEQLVFTNQHAASPAPAVAEQGRNGRIMPGHSARYYRALASLYEVTGDESVKQRALSGIHALTYMQSPAGLFRTDFFVVDEETRKRQRPDWYSQHLYTVCHLLELMPTFPELAPDGQDHVLDSSVFVREVRYAPGEVKFKTIAPARTVLKLSFAPKAVYAGKRKLPQAKQINDRAGWTFDPAINLLTIRHDAGWLKVE